MKPQRIIKDIKELAWLERNILSNSLLAFNKTCLQIVMLVVKMLALTKKGERRESS